MYIGELKLYRTAAAGQTVNTAYVDTLKASMDRVLAVMTDFSAVCPLMGLCTRFYSRYRETVYAHAGDSLLAIASQVMHIRDASNAVS